MNNTPAMHRVLLGSIALEPNRWTATKEPYNRLYDMLGPVQSAGFHSIELWEFHINQLNKDEIQDVASRAADLNITFPTLALYPDFLADPDDNQMYFDQLLQRCDFLGVKKIKMFAGNKSASELSEAERSESINQIRALIDAASRFGITLSGELHQDTLCDTVDEALRTVADLDNTIGICFQPLDFSSTETAVQDCKTLSESIDHVHLQGRKDGEFSSLEDADIDYKVLLPLLAESGYGGDYCIEFVEGCVVEKPSDFDMTVVLERAAHDRTFVEGILRG